MLIWKVLFLIRDNTLKWVHETLGDGLELYLDEYLSNDRITDYIETNIFHSTKEMNKKENSILEYEKEFEKRDVIDSKTQTTSLNITPKYKSINYKPLKLPEIIHPIIKTTENYIWDIEKNIKVIIFNFKKPKKIEFPGIHKSKNILINNYITKSDVIEEKIERTKDELKQKLKRNTQFLNDRQNAFRLPRI